MPRAANKFMSMTAHGLPGLSPGPGSPDVKIRYQKAWRALPDGVGAGVESASNAAKSLMDSPQLRPADATPKLVEIAQGLGQSAGAAAGAGNGGAPGATASAVAAMVAANVALTTAYTAAASSGPEPAAATTYTQGLQKVVAAAAGAAVSAIAAMTDMHKCLTVCPGGIHGPGVVTKGSSSVFINHLPAAREGDKVFEAAGGPDPIALGAPTVNIGG